MSAPAERRFGLAMWWQAIRRDHKAAAGAAILALFALVAAFRPLFVGDPKVNLTNQSELPLTDRTKFILQIPGTNAFRFIKRLRGVFYDQ